MAWLGADTDTSPPSHALLGVAIADFLEDPRPLALRAMYAVTAMESTRISPDVEIRLRCSKSGCGRVLEPRLFSGSTVRTEPLRLAGPDWHVDRPRDASAPGDGSRATYSCHERCGAVYTLRSDTLADAVLAAVQDGRSEIWLPL
jgi:hypothetical protein